MAQMTKCGKCGSRMVYEAMDPDTWRCPTCNATMFVYSDGHCEWHDESGRAFTPTTSFADGASCVEKLEQELKDLKTGKGW